MFGIPFFEPSDSPNFKFGTIITTNLYLIYCNTDIYIFSIRPKGKKHRAHKLNYRESAKANFLYSMYLILEEVRTIFIIIKIKGNT